MAASPGIKNKLTSLSTGSTYQVGQIIIARINPTHDNDDTVLQFNTSDLSHISHAKLCIQCLGSKGMEYERSLRGDSIEKYV